ncbi:MAG: hypothetical protein HC809_13750 [Gammaproteobacteria bacterium]|nr:hypothetical protein [Gammaproteobacteria bacterium]
MHGSKTLIGPECDVDAVETPTQSVAKQKIIDEIERLKLEYASRIRAGIPGSRPAPASLARAFQAVVSAQYERLDKLK